MCTTRVRRETVVDALVARDGFRRYAQASFLPWLRSEDPDAVGEDGVPDAGAGLEQAFEVLVQLGLRWLAWMSFSDAPSRWRSTTFWLGLLVLFLLCPWGGFVMPNPFLLTGRGTCANAIDWRGQCCLCRRPCKYVLLFVSGTVVHRPVLGSGFLAQRPS